MREIKTLIQQLRNYPNNLFVYTQEESEDNKSGLVVCNLAGEEQGFIELGSNDGQVIL
uniref:Uncharacterized protein n=1 Tax=viral metagenome TaxID=1070528 RepID=A0A6M3LTY7_9ZZZZ